MTINSQGRAKARTIRGAAVAAMLLGLILLAGCGSSSSSSSSASTPTTTAASAPATTTATTEASTAASETSAGTGAASTALKLEANKEGQLEYNTKSLTAKAGAVSIAFTNMSPVGHNVTIESSSGATVGATPTFQGGTKTLSLNLKAGTYKFFCSVPGHRMAGMEGTITVK